MKEYSYEIDKYIVGVDSNGEDGIGLTIATMKDNELHILGSCYGDNARFIDLLIKENQELKEKVKKLSQWDNNKDSRNSRQRVANAKLIKENQELKKIVELYSKSLYNAELTKYKEVIDKVRKEINEEHSIMGVEVVENWVLKDILKEV